jgi:hypothetical protein
MYPVQTLLYNLDMSYSYALLQKKTEGTELHYTMLSVRRERKYANGRIVIDDWFPWLTAVPCGHKWGSVDSGLSAWVYDFWYVSLKKFMTIKLSKLFFFQWNTKQKISMSFMWVLLFNNCVSHSRHSFLGDRLQTRKHKAAIQAVSSSTKFRSSWRVLWVNIKWNGCHRRDVYVGLS